MTPEFCLPSHYFLLNVGGGGGVTLTLTTLTLALDGGA